jgi:subtilisin family serine protease
VSDPSGDPERPWITPEQAREAIRDGDGKGVRIAVIDSGIEADHPKLRKMRLRDSIGVVEEEGRISMRPGEGFDVYGHGTAVASVIHSIAPEAEIGSFRVLDARNLSRTAIIQAGIYEAFRRGYHILNCSFGCKGLPRFVMPHKQWIDQAYVRGVHVVAACNNIDPREPEWPAHFPSVIGVGIASAAEGMEPGGSGFVYMPGELVEFAAPGENIEVAWTGHSTRVETGSSFAAPAVAGALARLLSVRQGLPPAHVLDLLPRLAKRSASADGFRAAAGRPSG